MKKMRLHSWALAVLVAAGLMRPGEMARGDVVTDWNTQFLSVISDSGTLSPVAARDMAMLNTAIYNSIQGITNNYEIYSTGSYGGPSATAVGGASMEAAAAAAAYTILSGISQYSSYASDFSTLYSNQLAGLADDSARTNGINYGVAVANDILNWRSADNSATAASTSYTIAGTFGSWVPTPPTNGTDPLLPGWGTVTPFAVASTAGYTTTLTAGTNSDYLATAQYTADYNQVKDLGALVGSTRTTDQTAIAYFWAAGQGTVTAVGMWNQIANTVAASAGLNLEEKSRLYAMLNVALADAAIISWDTVYANNFWRPVSGIAFGDGDGNPNTLGEASWESLIETPLFPEYGAPDSAIAAAAAKVLAEIFGDAFAFSLGSDIDGNGTIDLNRLFASFSQAAQEAGLAGIYGGTQFGTSVTDSQTTGTQVGAYVASNYFAPVPEPSGAVLVVFAVGGLMLRRRRR